MKSDILAAIDIGSNAVRLLINDIEISCGGYDFKKAAYLRVPIRLGEDVFTQNKVSASKAGLLIEAMQGFGHIMRAYSVSAFRACATSSMRDASNGDMLIKMIKERTGIGVEIISGKEEAELIYAAASLEEALDEKAACLCVDVGGGSTELVVGQAHQMIFHDSFQVGTVRMLNNAVTQAERERFTACLKKINELYSPHYIVASGGNINKAYKLIVKKGNDPIRPDDLEALHGKLKGRNIEERMHDFGLNDYRADVIVPALEIFMHVCKECQSIHSIHVPRIGLADGLIRDLHNKRFNTRQQCE